MDSKKIKILLVDDDEPVVSMYEEVFKKEGFEIEKAGDGVEGLDKASKNPPDIIFTGIVMPRMDGFQLIEALSKNVATSSIPVVISSHMGRKEDESRAKEMGVKDFIVRGMVTPREAAERIRAVFGSAEYNLKISAGEMDAPRLAGEFHFDKSYKCSYCGTDLIFLVRPSNFENREFSGKVFCPECGK